MGIPESDKAWLAFAAQAEIEDAGGTSYGAQHNNPLNILPSNPPWNGQTGTGPAGFANFDTLDHGVEACAYTYNHQGDGQTYAMVKAMYLTNDPVAIASAIERSPWDAGHYGDPNGNGNLTKLVRDNLSYVGGGEVPVTDDERFDLLFSEYFGGNLGVGQPTYEAEKQAWKTSGKGPGSYVDAITFFNDRNSNPYFARMADIKGFYDEYALPNLVDRVTAQVLAATSSSEIWSKKDNVQTTIQNILTARISELQVKIDNTVSAALAAHVQDWQTVMSNFAKSGLLGDRSPGAASK